jgi:NAD(P)-dependent dehydrogenase (short-subunit alcohol dehydrogenase family)
MGRVALITGGAQGIGAAAARRFLADGFDGVVLVDRNAARLAAEAKVLSVLGRVETLAVDLADEAAPAAAVQLTVKNFGRLDVLVNAAGNTERCGISDVTPESYGRLFDVNVKAPLFMMQEAATAMLPNRAGVMINVASMLAHGGPPNLAIYSASKAALVLLTKNAANTWKREGIRAFAINLGWVASEGEQKTQTEFHKLPADWADTMGKRMPFGRLIMPDDVAGLCAYLVSESAQMMTGAVIDYEQMPVGVFDAHPALGPE